MPSRRVLHSVPGALPGSDELSRYRWSRTRPTAPTPRTEPSVESLATVTTLSCVRAEDMFVGEPKPTRCNAIIRLVGLALAAAATLVLFVLVSAIILVVTFS